MVVPPATVCNPAGGHRRCIMASVPESLKIEEAAEKGEAATKKRRSTVPGRFHDPRGKSAGSPWLYEPP